MYLRMRNVFSLIMCRHANNHLVEDELERDMKLAQEIALASPSSSPIVEALVLVSFLRILLKIAYTLIRQEEVTIGRVNFYVFVQL